VCVREPNSGQKKLHFRSIMQKHNERELGPKTAVVTGHRKLLKLGRHTILAVNLAPYCFFW